MYKRANWCVFGIKEGKDKFADAVNSSRTLFDSSAVLALVGCRMNEISTVGINPFLTPRLDETVNAVLDAAFMQDMHKFGSSSESEKAAMDVDSYLPFCGNKEVDFKLDNGQYAFWYVIFEWKDSNHVPSIKEKMAYENQQRPYAFLQGDEKKQIDAIASSQTSVVRKQFPVFIDFGVGLVFAETNAPKEIEALWGTLQGLGVEPEPRYWYFGENWVTKFLTHLTKNTTYHDEFAKRADELTRFSKKEVPKLDDKTLEKIVANYFSLTEIPGGDWAALKTPAQFKLQPTADAPLTASTPSNAYTLMTLTDNSIPVGASVVFQEVHEKKKPDDTVQLIYKDKFSITVSEAINDMEHGLAFIPGFDVPGLKRDINKQIRKTKQAPDLIYYWQEWRRELWLSTLSFADYVKQALDIDASDEDFGLITFQKLPSKEESVTVNAE